MVLEAVKGAAGGEIFVPRIPSMRITDLARAIAPDCKVEVVGIRPGEKLHECMVPAEDSRNVVLSDKGYIILPDTGVFNYQGDVQGAEPVPKVSV